MKLKVSVWVLGIVLLSGVGSVQFYPNTWTIRTPVSPTVSCLWPRPPGVPGGGNG
jgi:hypothetical protein